MNNKIVWVYGPSAAGKETFIVYIEKIQPKEILKRLGFNDKKLIICKESIDWVAQSKEDPKKELRKSLANIIIEYSKVNSNSVILIKGQDIDFNNEHLITVKNALVEDSHEILYLYLDFQDLYSRYVQKPWWDNLKTKKVCLGSLKKQVKKIEAHEAKGFRIKALDSSNKKYIDANFPPDLYE